MNKTFVCKHCDVVIEVKYGWGGGGGGKNLCWICYVRTKAPSKFSVPDLSKFSVELWNNEKNCYNCGKKGCSNAFCY